MPMKELLPRLLLVALAYYLTGRVGLEFASWGNQVTLIWPPTGIALFALLAWGPRMLPAIWLASLAINLPLGPSPAGAMVIATGDTLGPALAALALGRTGFDHHFGQVRDVFAYIGFGVMAGMAVNATMGVTTLVLAGALPMADAAQVWLTWWLGDALGALLLGPALLTLRAPPAAPVHPPAWHEAVLVWGGLIITGVVCSTPLSPFAAGLPPLLSFPFGVWLAMRRDTKSVSWAVLLLASLSLWGVLAGMGPFVDPQGRVQLQALWSYLFVLGLGGLLIPALRAETGLALAKSLANEARLKEAEHIARLGHWELDLVSNHLVWSDEIYRIFGLDKFAFGASYEAFLDAVHPEDRAYVNERYTGAVAGRFPYDIEHRIIRRSDGAVRWVHEWCEHLRNEQGQIVRSKGTVQDITERKVAEIELEQYRQNLERVVQKRTHALAQALDAAEAAITERKQSEAALTELKDCLEQKVAERTSDLQSEIRQRIEAEAALRESEQHFRTTFQNSPIGIVEATAADEHFLAVNPAFCAMVGYEEGELLGRSVAELTHPDDRLADLEGLHGLFQGEVPVYQSEKRYVHKRGQIICAEVTVSLVRDAEGKPLHTVATVADTSRQRELQLAAREHLEAASWLQRQQTANELATLLAHELNQPLAAIATFAEASRQLMRRSPPDQDKLAANLERIGQQALRAGDTIRHLRAFVSRGQIDPVPMDLKTVVRSACDLMAAKARGAGIKLEAKLQGKLPPVMGVDVHVEQVLLNLLRNAYEAIRDAGMDGGTITVQLQRVEGMAQVTVRDTGPGIDADAAARLFEPLSSTKNYGLGVGLRISRSLIEAHGGRLWVEPHTPDGIFHFELPLEP
jgi:PAS domain S-box-containing protein